MAEGDASVYNHFKELLLTGAVDLSSDTLKIALLGSGYTFSADGNNGYASVTASEISATGYTAGGASLATLTVAQDDTNDRASFDAADVTWSSLATATIAHAVLYDDTITAGTADPLLIRWEISTNSNGGDYTLQFHSDGVLLLS